MSILFALNHFGMDLVSKAKIFNKEIYHFHFGKQKSYHEFLVCDI